MLDHFGRADRRVGRAGRVLAERALAPGAFVAEVSGGSVELGLEQLEARFGPALAVATLGDRGSVARGGGKIIRDFGLFGPAVADGEQYRIVTSAFLHAGLIHLGLNMFVLYILGTLLEPAVGTARFVAIYAASVLGGSFVALVMDPNELTVGASGGIFGLMSAAFLIARNRGLDQLASQLGFFVILNLVFTFSISNISIGAHLGGLAGGALAGLLVTMVESRRLRSAQAIEIGGMFVLCVGAVVGALIAADASVPSLA